MEKSELNILQRINEVRKAIDYIKKEKDVGTYKVVTHDQVTAMVREHMVQHGIVCYPSFVEGAMNLPIVDKDGNLAKQGRYEATYDFMFSNIDNLDETIVIRIQAHAMDNADKAPGKALSYAKKYAILKLFEIETGEDEESPYHEAGLSDDRIELLIVKIKSKQGEAKKAEYKLAMNECRKLGDLDAANKIKEALL